jgi:hypothetical protein
MSRSGLLAACLLFGCASIPRPVHPFMDPEAALHQHQLSREQVQAIRAEARVDQRGHQGRIKGTVLMFVQRPAQVRFDAMTQFGPVAILTSDGQSFAYSDLRQHRFLTGETCPKNIARLLNIALSVDQTTLLLLGGTPLIVHERASIEWNEDGFYRVLLRARDGARQEVDLAVPRSDGVAPPERQALSLLRSEVYDRRGRSRLRLRYEDYRPLQSGGRMVATPFTVRVEMPVEGSDTLIRFKEIALDVQVPKEAFVQTQLPGMQPEVASCD